VTPKPAVSRRPCLWYAPRLGNVRLVDGRQLSAVTGTPQEPYWAVATDAIRDAGPT